MIFPLSPKEFNSSEKTIKMAVPVPKHYEKN